MKGTYPIEGMSCNGCRTYVENTLNKIEGVKTATVDLQKGEAVVDADALVSFKKL
jgi:Cu2+-exporting ATPase